MRRGIEGERKRDGDGGRRRGSFVIGGQGGRMGRGERGEKRRRQFLRMGEDDFGRLGHMYKTFRRLFN